MDSGLVGPNGAPLDLPEGAYVKDGAAKATIAEAFAIVHQETPKILGPVVQRMASDMGTMRADLANLIERVNALTRMLEQPPMPGANERIMKLVP